MGTPASFCVGDIRRYFVGRTAFAGGISVKPVSE
jgi:hypothetical protein